MTLDERHNEVIKSHAAFLNAVGVAAAGGAGFYRASGVEIRFRDLQGARFHPLQEKPQQVLAARMALGLPIDA